MGALWITCDSCGDDLEDQGGLLFGPPRLIDFGSIPQAAKYHLCVECFETVCSTMGLVF